MSTQINEWFLDIAKRKFVEGPSVKFDLDFCRRLQTERRATAIVSNKLLILNFVHDPQLLACLDPAPRESFLREGLLGSVFGVQVYLDTSNIGLVAQSLEIIYIIEQDNSLTKHEITS